MTPKYVQDCIANMKALLRRKYKDASRGRIDRLVDSAAAVDAFLNGKDTRTEVLYRDPETLFTRHLESIGAELSQPIPSPQELFDRALEQNPGMLSKNRLELWRELQDLDDDARIARGKKLDELAPPPEKQAASQKTNPHYSKAPTQADADQLLTDTTGIDARQHPQRRRRSTLSHLQQENARRADKVFAHEAVSSKTAGQLSPADRLTKHRLDQELRKKA